MLEAVRQGHLPRRQRRPAHVQRLPVRHRQSRVQHERPDGRVRQRRHPDTALVRLRVHGLDMVGPERRETGNGVPAPKSGRGRRHVRGSVLGGRYALTPSPVPLLAAGRESGLRGGSDGEKNNKILTTENIFVSRNSGGFDDGPAKAMMLNPPPSVFVESMRKKSANNKNTAFANTTTITFIARPRGFIFGTMILDRGPLLIRGHSSHEWSADKKYFFYIFIYWAAYILESKR